MAERTPHNPDCEWDEFYIAYEQGTAKEHSWSICEPHKLYLGYPDALPEFGSGVKNESH